MTSIKQKARSKAGKFVSREEGKDIQNVSKVGRPRKSKKADAVSKIFEISLTISIGGSDMDPSLLQIVQRFLVNETMAEKCSLERGGAAFHLHIQGVIRIHSTSVIAVGKLLKHYLDWDVHPPVASIVMCRKLKNNGLHTFIGLIGYCMKDIDQPHFLTIDHNISAHHIENGLLQFALHGANDKRSRVCLNSKNTFERCAMFWQYNAKRPSLLDIETLLYEMVKSSCFYLAMGWIGGGNGRGFPRRKVEALLRAMFTLALVSREDVMEIFLQEDVLPTNVIPRLDWFFERWKNKNQGLLVTGDNKKAAPVTIDLVEESGGTARTAHQKDRNAKKSMFVLTLTTKDKGKGKVDKSKSFVCCSNDSKSVGLDKHFVSMLAGFDIPLYKRKEPGIVIA